MTARVFDDTQCDFGEGPLWHPEREQLFWFDINAHRLYTRDGDGRRMWQFDEYVSAAGWVSRDQMLIASETALFLFDLEADCIDHICDLAAHAIPGSRPTCPAFGGPDLTTLHVTTARQQMDAPGEMDGRTFALEGAAKGQTEHRVIL